jgi:hypothetical protein
MAIQQVLQFCAGSNVKDAGKCFRENTTFNGTLLKYIQKNASFDVR